VGNGIKQKKNGNQIIEHGHNMLVTILWDIELIAIYDNMLKSLCTRNSNSWYFGP